MVAFSGSFNPGLLVYPYPDENPNYPPQVGMVPIGLRGAMEPVQQRVGDFDNTQPITQLGRALAGDTWRSYFEDYYNRVWMIPTTVDFGPITATTGKQVYLWNAHLYDITLEQITAPSDTSLSIVGLNVPSEINALGGTYYYVYADINGQPSINDAFTFTFDPVEVVSLPILGIRARLWPWVPNWGEGFEVTYEFRTEIITSDNGKEQRIATRQSPRKSMSFQSHVNENQFRIWSRQMTIWAGRSTIVPEFSKYVRLKYTAYNGQGFINVLEIPDWVAPEVVLVLIDGDRTLLRTIDEIDTDTNTITFTSNIEGEWMADTKAMKGVAGRLSNETSATQYTNRLAVVDLDFNADPGVEAYPDPGAAPLTFNGREVLLKRPNWKDRLNPSYQSYLQQVDYGTGRIDNFLPITFNDKIHKANYVGKTIEETEEIERFLFRMLGQQGEFYMPTFTEDMVLKPDQTIPATTSNIRIEGPEFSRDMALDTIYKDLIIFLEGGGYLMRRVQSIYEVDDTYGNDSIVQVTTAFPSTITPDMIRQICWMPLWRLASDSMTFSFVTDTVCQFAMTMKTLEYEDAE